MLLTKKEIDMLNAFAVGIVHKHSGAVLGTYPGENYGKGTDFHEYQQYSYGEDLRWVDWHRYQRSRQLAVKSFERFEQVEYVMIVDLSDSIMCNGSEKRDVIIRQAEALGLIFLNNHIKISLSFVGEKNLLKFSHISDFDDYCRVLEGAAVGGKTDIAEHISAIELRSDNSVVLSDMLAQDGIDSLEKTLNGCRGSMTMFNISTPQERKPTLAGDLLLVDAECGAKVPVRVDERTVSEYVRLRDDYYQQLQKYCSRRSWMYYERYCEVEMMEYLTGIVQNGALFL